MEAREDDWVTQLFVVSTHAYVFFFSDKGKVYVKKVYEIPQAARTSKGRAIVNFIGIEAGEKVAAIALVPKIREGQVRRHPHARRARSRRPSSTSTRTSARRASSASRSTKTTSSSTRRSPTARASSLIATKGGQSIRFPEEQVRPMGRATHGVKGDRYRRGRRGRRPRGERPGRGPRARDVRERLRQAHAHRRVPARRTAAARASSSSTRASATARSSG